MSNLSGKAWWDANQANWPNSTEAADLEPEFRESVQRFLSALSEAGARVKINSTRRDPLRAYLMHYAWRLAHGEIQAAEIPPPPSEIRNPKSEIRNPKSGNPYPPALPCPDIEWDHGNEERSRQAAREMISRDCFNMAFAASLTSTHIDGKAIDMTITWDGPLQIRERDGTLTEITSLPRDGANVELHAIGATYGVIKHPTDRPHWSVDGT